MGGFVRAFLCLALFSFGAAARPAAMGRRLARNADRLLAHHSLTEVTRDYPDDCSGLVRYVYSRAGVRLGEDVSSGSEAAALYRASVRRGELRRRTARPGDLVFFRDTWDRNADGRIDDGITHVGVVDSVGRDGRVSFVHRSNSGIERSVLDVRHPRLRRDRKGRVHNDVLRREGRGHRAMSTGELLAGFATPRR
jgi:hypothetical protein